MIKFLIDVWWIERSKLLSRNSRFEECYNIKYFKEIKYLKSLQNAEAYLEPKRASAMKLFREYT